jgi:microcystin-dependent protein
MPDPITRIVFRRGLYSEKVDLILLQGEPGYTIDAKRLFIGDGVTAGGVPVGMKNLGIAPFGVTSTNLTSDQINLRGQPGDIIFDSTTTCLWSLTGTEPGLVSNYAKVASTVGPDNLTIVSNNNALSVKQNSLNATYVSSVFVGRGLERITSNTVLRIADPSSELSFSGNQLTITDAGVTNTKLANMPPNTVKARLYTTGTPSDLPISQLADIIAPLVTPQVDGVPTGVVLDFAGATPPTGYLICQGQAVSRTTYSGLFSIIGTTWGAGNGSTTFNLPDFRRRVTVGSGGTGTSTLGNNLANSGGAEVHTLTINEIPSHDHNLKANSLNDANRGALRATGFEPLIHENYKTYTNTRQQIDDTGGDLPHNNIQPSVIVNKIIKT